jgi:hypothetical protein
MVAQNRLLDALAPYDCIVVCGRDNFDFFPEGVRFHRITKIRREWTFTDTRSGPLWICCVESEEGGIENGVFHTTSKVQFI